MKSCPQCQRDVPERRWASARSRGLRSSFASMVPVGESSDDTRIGTKLAGRYEIRRVVADGGMGRVYEGIDKQTDSRVAVKVLHDDVAKDDVSLERFKREYEISANLPHDYIVSVTDFQRDRRRGVWLLVMEYLEGEELRLVLKREKAMAPARLVRMLSQVALGLDEAHASPVRSPRPEARQHLPLRHARGGRGQAPRLRLREGQEQGREEAHRPRHDDRLAVLHGAGAGAGARHARRARRRLRARAPSPTSASRVTSPSTARTARPSSSRS